METNYATGAVRSPYDKRDITSSRLKNDGMVSAIQIPETYFTDISMIPVYNQAHQPSCVAHAGATIKEYLDYKDTGERRTYSKRFLYSLAKSKDGLPDVDGTYPRVAWSQLASVGACDENLVHDDVSLSRKEYNNPTTSKEIFNNAQPRIIKSYSAVSPLTFDELKEAIFRYEVVAILIGLDNSFFHTVNGHLTPPASRLSGHEMFCYGYDKNRIYFRNSHGTSWGNGGNGDFGVDYMPHVEEAHYFLDLPDSYVEKITKQLSILQQIVELFKQLKFLKK